MDLEQLGPFQIIGKLGEGGMGSVYAAVDEDDQKFAVKVMPAQLARQEGFRARFETEVETLKQLDHPNIVRLYGYGEQDELLFYSMELVEGQNIEQLLRAEREFTWAQVCEIGRQLASALAHAHARGVVHRDIKPANILLTPDNQVKLTDFGIARLFSQGPGTMDGGLLGTANYMSPEQAEGRPATESSDLYSLGMVLYAMLAGRPPFLSRSLPEMLQLQRYADPPDLTELAPQTPAPLVRLVHRLLAKDPDDRVARADALQRRLNEVLEGWFKPGEVDPDASSTGIDDLTPVDASGQIQIEPAGHEREQTAASLFETQDAAAGGDQPDLSGHTDIFHFADANDPRAGSTALLPSISAFDPDDDDETRTPASMDELAAADRAASDASGIDLDGMLDQTLDVAPEHAAAGSAIFAPPGSDLSANGLTTEGLPALTGSAFDSGFIDGPPTDTLQIDSIDTMDTHPDDSGDVGETVVRSDETGPPSSVHLDDAGYELADATSDPSARSESIKDDDTEDPGEASAATFTTVDSSDATATKRKRSAVGSSIWLIVALAVLIGLVYLLWQSTQPAGPETLYARIQDAARSGDPDEMLRIDYAIQTFMREHPDDPRTAELAALREEIELIRLERALRSRANIRRRAETITGGEVAFIHAFDLMESDPHRALDRLRHLVALHEPGTGRADPLRPFIELAKTHIARLEKLELRDAVSQIRSLQERLDTIDSLIETDPQRARQMAAAIVGLYADQSWAGDEVAEARAVLARLARKWPLQEPEFGIAQGMSQADVIGVLGPPAARSAESDGIEVWKYDALAVDGRTIDLQVRFETDDRVASWQTVTPDQPIID